MVAHESLGRRGGKVDYTAESPLRRIFLPHPPVAPEHPEGELQGAGRHQRIFNPGHVISRQSPRPDCRHFPVAREGTLAWRKLVAPWPVFLDVALPPVPCPFIGDRKGSAPAMTFKGHNAGERPSPILRAYSQAAASIIHFFRQIAIPAT